MVIYLTRSFGSYLPLYHPDLARKNKQHCFCTVSRPPLGLLRKHVPICWGSLPILLSLSLSPSLSACKIIPYSWLSSPPIPPRTLLKKMNTIATTWCPWHISACSERADLWSLWILVGPIWYLYIAISQSLYPCYVRDNDGVCGSHGCLQGDLQGGVFK